MKNKPLLIFLAFAYLFLNGCSSTKFLKEGSYLVTKNSIHILQPENIKKDKQVKQDLLEIAKPKPNSGGAFKVPLRIYGYTENRKEKGFKNFLRKKYAEAPSIYDPQKVEVSTLKMEKYLLDHGFIGSKVSADTLTRKKKIEIEYNVSIKQRHTIREVTHIKDTTEIGYYLEEFARFSLIKVGDFYSKSNIDEERARLSLSLQNKGYLDVSEENFYFTVDTQHVDHVVDITINYKLPKGSKSLVRYRLGTTNLFTLDDGARARKLVPDTVAVKPGLSSIQYYEILRPKILDFTVDQDSSEIISFERQQLTVNHFVSYGIYSFVNQKYSSPYGDSLNILDRNIYLTPGSDASVGLEFELNNRTGNFFGTAITGSYKNNNSFKGAEIFSTGLSLGTELQVNNNQNLLNTLIVDFNLGVEIPRLLIPYFYNKPPKFHIPRTKVSLSNLFESRSASFTAIRSTLQYAYQWRENKRSNHSLAPLSVSYLNLLSTTPAFDTLILTDVRLQLSLQNVIDLGLEYTYTFTNQDPNKTDNYIYFNINPRFSGNLLNAIISKENALGQKTLFDTPFAQYAKLTLDYRFFIPHRKSKLVYRFHAGLAYAYGNSEEIPFNEQYAVGGAQSLRGFPFRGLGPGSFVLDPTNTTISDLTVINQNFDQTGDILFETNLEYRFPMAGFLKGAVFLDIGNVWLLNKNQGKPGGLFQFDTFYKQLGINTGYGFRFDFDFLVLRLDLGFVLRRPYLNEGFEWTPSRSDAFTNEWLFNNLNLQIGIGYPF